MTDLLVRQDELTDDDFTGRLAALRAERKRLQELPDEPEQVIERPTGMKARDLWLSLSAAGKRELLLRAKVKVHASRGYVQAERPSDPDLLVALLAKA
jgi:hypothetical protein